MHTHRYLKNVSTLEYDPSRCTACGMCIEVCPHNVFALNGRQAEIIHSDSCMECGACALNCVFGALQVKQGVGCAAAVIIGFLKGTEPNCDCSKEEICC
jgi:NAD-dependent dihydropyrimidine dehydrogenase PreA subunit